MDPAADSIGTDRPSSLADRARDAELAHHARRATAAEEEARDLRARLRAVEAERDRQARELGALARALVEIEDRTAEESDEARQGRKVEANLRSRVAYLEGRLAESPLRSKVAELEGRLAVAEAQAAELRASTSWRLTAPLRAASALLRRRGVPPATIHLTETHQKGSP